MTDDYLSPLHVHTLDRIHHARWANTATLNPDAVTHLEHAGYTTTRDGWTRLTPTGWDLYEVGAA